MATHKPTKKRGLTLHDQEGRPSTQQPNRVGGKH